jgi:tetraacyldisaccharide 4'-kinase
MGSDRLPFPYPYSKIPVFHGALTPTVETSQRFQGQPVIAFCGLGFPQKFFSTLASMGCKILATHSFPDHHPYTIEEIARLKQQAAGSDASLVTTEKDWVRLDPHLRHGIEIVKIEAHIDATDQLINHIESHL